MLKPSNPTRLHLLNQNYIVRFDLMRWTKSKRLIKSEDFQELWNSQSIEVRGKIYVVGGTIANTRTYLKQTLRLNEDTMSFEKMADM